MRALIGFWGDARVQSEMDSAMRNQASSEEIEKMAEKRFDRDWTQCRAKIKKLKNDHKNLMDTADTWNPRVLFVGRSH